MSALPVALLHFNGADGSTDFPDPIGNVWTANNSTVTAAQAKFGSGSGAILGTVSTPDAPALRLTADLTIDAWVWFNSLPPDDGGMNVATKTTYGFFVVASPDGLTQYLQFYWQDADNNPQSVQVEWTPTIDTWIHIEFDHSGDDGYFFVHGTQVGSTQSVPAPFFAADQDLFTEGIVDGYIDELRICNFADHTSDFTPASAPYEVPQIATGSIPLPLKQVLGAGAVGTVGRGVIPLLLKQVLGAGVSNQAAASSFFLPMLKVAAAGTSGRAGRGDIRLPLKQVLAYTGTAARLTLPMLQVFARGAPGLIGAAALRLPMQTVLGGMRADGLAAGAVRLPLLGVLGSGASGNTARVQLTLPLIRLLGTGTSGGIGRAAVTLPLLQVLARGIADRVAAGRITLPLLQVLGVLTPPVAEHYRAWALNLRNKALTEYTNFDFNSFAIVDGKVLAASDDGLFILDASDLDGAVEIDALGRTGISDLGDSYTKRVPRIYYSGLLTDDMLYSAITREQGKHTYRLSQQGRVGLQQRPLQVGNGLKSRYWQFEFQNENGGDLSVHSLLIKDAGTRRRIQ